MKLRLLLLAITLLATSALLTPAQNTIKLFDATPIGVGSAPWSNTYAAKQVHLECGKGGKTYAVLSGPGGGQLIAANGVFINGDAAGGVKGVRKMSSFFSGFTADPMALLGAPVEAAYLGVDPVDVSRQVRRSGLYTFELVEWGATFGNSEIYLTSTCGVLGVTD